MLLLLLLFWDLMDSSERSMCWQQGAVCKDSQWGEGRVTGGAGGPLTVHVLSMATSRRKVMVIIEEEATQLPPTVLTEGRGNTTS